MLLTSAQSGRGLHPSPVAARGYLPTILFSIESPSRDNLGLIPLCLLLLGTLTGGIFWNIDMVKNYHSNTFDSNTGKQKLFKTNSWKKKSKSKIISSTNRRRRMLHLVLMAIILESHPSIYQFSGGPTSINTSIGYKWRLKNKIVFRDLKMWSILCAGGDLLVMVFERNYPEQKYKQTCLSQPLLPLLRSSLFLAIHIPWSCFVFGTAYNCLGFTRATCYQSHFLPTFLIFGLYNFIHSNSLTSIPVVNSLSLRSRLLF